MVATTNTMALNAVNSYPTSCSVTTNLSAMIPPTILFPANRIAVQTAVADNIEEWYIPFVQLANNVIANIAAETVIISDGMTRLVAKARASTAESVTIGAGTLARLAAKLRASSTAETITVSEPSPPARLRNKPRAPANETVTISGETLGRLTAKIRSRIETTSLSESVLRLAAKKRAPTAAESITIGAGTVTRIKGIIRTLTPESNTIGAGTLTRLANKFRARTESTITISESQTRLVAKLRTVSQTITIGETLARQATKARALAAQTVTIGEAIARLLAKIRIPGQILYDDFNASTYNFTEGGASPNAKWNNIYRSGGTTGTRFASSVNSNVMYQIPSVATSSGASFATLNQTVSTWENFDLTIRVKTVQQLRQNNPPNNWERAWVFFRLVDSTHVYYFVMKNVGCEIGKSDQGQQQIFLGTTGSPSIPVGDWASVRIRCISDTARARILISVWVNGSIVFNELSDDSSLTAYPPSATMFNPGAIGLYNEDSEVEFDDLQILSVPTIAVSDSISRTVSSGQNNIVRTLASETVVISAGTVTRAINKFRALVAQVTAISESLTRIAGKKRTLGAETNTIGAGTLTRTLAKIRVLSTETVTVGSGSLTRLVAKIRLLAAETITVGAGSLTRLATKKRVPASETTAISEAVAKVRSRIKAVSAETVTIGAGTITRLAKKIRALATEISTVSESITRAVSHPGAISRSLTESITIASGVLTRLKTTKRSPGAESVTISETLTRLTAKIRAISVQTVLVPDSVSRSVGKIRVLAAQTVTISEAVTRTVSHAANIVRSLVETITISDTLTRLATKKRALSLETIAINESLIRTKGKVRALAAQTIAVSDSIARRAAKIRILSHTLNIVEQLEVFKNGIRLVIPQRPDKGGYTKKLKQPKLKQILYPVYSPAEFQRIERRRRLRQYPPLIVIPAFKQNINQTVAPFVITDPARNEVIVRFAITMGIAITYTGKAIPISIQPKQEQRRLNKAKCVSFIANQQALEQYGRKLNKLSKLMKLWSIYFSSLHQS